MKNKKHSEETKHKMSLAAKGNQRWLGKKHTEETKNKMRLARIKNNPMKNPDVVKKRTETLIRNGTFKGEKNNTWKGGKTKLGILIRNSIEYSIWRKTIFERDNWTCIKCGLTSKIGIKCILQAHHKFSFSKIIRDYKIKNMAEAISCKELWNINNGETICKECHSNTETFAKHLKHHA